MHQKRANIHEEHVFVRIGSAELSPASLRNPRRELGFPADRTSMGLILPFNWNISLLGNKILMSEVCYKPVFVGFSFPVRFDDRLKWIFEER